MQKQNIIQLILKWIKLLFLISFVVLFTFVLNRGARGFLNPVWNKEDVFSYVKIGEQIKLYSFHPKENKLYIVKFPQELLIETAKGYGEYKIKNIFKLGEQEKIGGGKLLSYSLQNYLRGPVLGWIINNQRLKILGQSNFTWWDRVRLQWNENNLKFNQKEEIDLKAEGFLEKEKLADGTEIWRFKESEKEDLAIKIFGDSKIISVTPQVKVLNATEKNLIGKRVAEMLRNIGYQVVTVKNNQNMLENSHILYQNSNFSVKKLQRIFSLSRVEEKNNLEVDIVLYIGLDYWREYWGK